MTIELSKRDVLEVIDKDLLMEKLAYRIIEKNKDHSWGELEKSLIDAVKKSAEIIIKEMSELYSLQETMKRQVRAALESLTKKEILSFLGGDESNLPF